MINYKIEKIVMMTLITLCFTQNVYAKIFVLVGPSGVGKSTLINKFLSTEFKVDELVSYATRPIRVGEKNGKDYFFVSMNEYKRREKSNEFILSTMVHGNLYGIPKKQINDALKADRNLFCSLNIEAAKKFKSLFDAKMVTIFVAPPSFSELKNRLVRRGEKENVMNIRLENATNELKEQDSFDYKIVNNNIEQSLVQLKKIFFSETAL